MCNKYMEKVSGKLNKDGLLKGIILGSVNLEDLCDLDYIVEMFHDGYDLCHLEDYILHTDWYMTSLAGGEM